MPRPRLALLALLLVLLIGLAAQGELDLPFAYSLPSLPGQPTPLPGGNLSLPSPRSATPVSTAAGAPANLADLQQTMLGLINRDRQAAGVQAVAWDETAAAAGQAHAADMLANSYMSHWDMSGHGPDYRYARAGGQDADFENVHSSYQRYLIGRGVPITDWNAKLAEVEDGFMNSPGHRDNILDRGHTHVGIGIAYDAARGELRVAQEFVNRYAEIEPTPAEAKIGATVQLRGRLLRSDLQPILVSVAYEPFPKPMTVEELQQTGSYLMAGGSEAGEVGLRPQLRGDALQASLTLNKDGKPGLYHLRVWVTVAGKQTLAVDRIAEVR